MPRIEEKSKSLNKILESWPEEKKKEVRSWWRKKLLLSYLLSAFCAVDGFIIGFIVFGGK